MSAQLDLISGNDLSALSSVTQEDLMQAINKVAPLSNIGLIVASATRPDITNNPRFIRYGWLDITTPSTPVLKAYTADRTTLVDLDASWTTVSGALSSILTSMFAARSASGGVTIDLVKTNSAYTNAGNGYYLLRVASNGKDVEAVTLDIALSGGGGVALARLDTTGIGAGKFIGYNAGVAGYVSIVPSTDLIGSSRLAVETNVLPAGTPLYVPRTNAAGTALEHVTPNSLFANNELAVARLLATGAQANDVLRFNGTTWEKVTPTLRMVAADAANSGILGSSSVGSAFQNIAHGLATIPKLIDVRLRQTNAVADIGYNQNDEVPLCAYATTSNNVNGCYAADATNVQVLFHSVTGMLPTKGAGTYAGIDETKWFPVVYAWK
jgi:hypothetical protein